MHSDTSMTDKKFLSAVTRPGRYLGREHNSYFPEWSDDAVKFALIFPDLYEIGMSHQGLQILYHILNRRPRMVAERCYCPDIDAEQLLRSNRTPLTSLETGRFLTDFDVIGFTLPYELCYTNILTVLELAGIPFRSADRDDSYPLILGGGACSLNPEPVADFFDAILLGDGEEAIIEIGEIIRDHKNIDKKQLLQQLETIEGIYIPSHFKPVHMENDHQGRLREIVRLSGKGTVSRRIVENLDSLDHLLTPLVPNAKIVHDRLGVEVARGCTRGCRFCQAGMTYRPVRERTPEQVKRLAIEGITNSGFEELALLSLSTGDYSCLDQSLPALMDKFGDSYVSVAMPSMRVGTLTSTIMEQVKRVRKTGFTLAPEAGSERLRQVINKGITEDDLIQTCDTAFSLGWRLIKCYFMIGLPTETATDINEIILLVRKILAGHNLGKSGTSRQVNVSVGTFVPKPHTPFQWEQQLSIENSRENFRTLRDGLPRKGCNFKYHDPETSFLEGVFSRGDRRLSRLLETAWKNGARLDGWAEHFDLETWRNSGDQCGIDLDSYLRRRDINEILPWSHLDSAVSNDFLADELKKSKNLVYTPDCRYHACQKCGVCDFKRIMPIVHNRSQKPHPPTPVKARTNGSETHFKYMVHYSRTGDICYLGHLEIMQVIFRALKRCELPTHYSRGFNPLPKISLGPALPVGTESMAEYFIMDLNSPLDSIGRTITRLNSSLPVGIKVTGIELHSGKTPQKTTVAYVIYLPGESKEFDLFRLDSFMEADSFFVAKTRKGKTKKLDIRPMVNSCSFGDDGRIEMEFFSETATPGIKPVEALSAILELSPEQAQQLRVVKTGWTSLDKPKSQKSPGQR